MISLRNVCALGFLVVSSVALAQAGDPSMRQAAPAAAPAAKEPAVVPHTVNADGTVTFRYRDKNVKSISVNVESATHSFPMTMDDTGLWTVTTTPFAPEYYGYTFNVDGVQLTDTRNIDVRRNYLGNSSNFLIPAMPAAPWEPTAIPHGDVIARSYTSAIVKNHPLNQFPYDVYLPPGYDAKRKVGYPVLYLLHGFSDPEYAWINVGHANLMLDAMIAEGKAAPMIVVMPLGYGDLNVVTHRELKASEDESVTLFSQALLTEIMPAVEHDYNVAKGRNSRAITGLSMGGEESVTIGLKHPELFVYVGGFSSGGFHGDKLDVTFPGIDAKKADYKLLWIACGSSDGLLKSNTDLIAWLKGKNFDVTAIQTPGAHNWIVWRDNLMHFAPLLFRGK